MRRLLPRSIVLRYCSSNNRPPPSSCGWSAPAAARTRGYHASSTRYVRQQQQQQQRSTPKLAYEWIVDGKVVPPSSSADDDHRDILVPPPPPWGGGGEKKEVIVFLHGLLGNAKNLRTPAKRLTRSLPGYAALMLDIRGHGKSSSSSSSSPSSSFDRPHDFRSCVHDVFGTLAPLGLIGTDSPYAICGHSLGGRIALEYSHAVRTASSSFAPSGADGGGRSDALASEARRFRQPGQTWILDSVPGKADPSVHAVLRAVSSLPAPIPSRRWVVETLTGEPHVLDVSLARWIATNLREREEDDCGGIGWAFDLDVANDLVRNFADQDFVGMIRDLTADAPGDPSSSPISSSSSSSSSSSYSQCGDDDGPHSTTAVHLVMAGKSKSWTEDVVSELESIPSFSRGHSSSSSSSPPSSSFRMHKLDRAGHWVHVDDLEGLMALMVDGLQQGRPARG